MSIWNLTKWALVLGIIMLTGLNASWIAPAPKGALKLIAAHGIDADKDGCINQGGLDRAFQDHAEIVVVPTAPRKGCSTLSEAIYYGPARKFMADMGSDASDAAATRAVFAGRKRDIDKRYSFTGDAAAVADISKTNPQAWAWSAAQARACFDAYVRTGWTSIMPAICAGKTITVPLDQQWKAWGWPKRFMARMDAAKVRVILTGPATPDGTITGLSALEQIPQVPRDFTGYLWVEDIGLIGPALRR